MTHYSQPQHSGQRTPLRLSHSLSLSLKRQHSTDNSVSQPFVLSICSALRCAQTSASRALRALYWLAVLLGKPFDRDTGDALLSTVTTHHGRLGRLPERRIEEGREERAGPSSRP